MANEKKRERKTFTLPEGRLINHALFERDIYKDPKTGKENDPRYQIELAFDAKQIEGEGTIEDQLLDEALAEFGDSKATEDAFFGGDIRVPFLNGDELAKKREEKGKQGDAYKGKLVIRAATTFNKDGVAGPGGIAVYGPGGGEDPISTNHGNVDSVYPGCYGIAAVTIAAGVDPGRGGGRYTKFWLVGFQKTRDGEKLFSGRDTASLFKPVGRTEGASEGRRSRRG